MARELSEWKAAIETEFGIELSILAIDPGDLWADQVQLSCREKVEALADWCHHNESNKVPLVTCDGDRLTDFVDLLRILQEG